MVDDTRSIAAYQAELTELILAAEDLQANAASMHFGVLEASVYILGCRGRILQDDYMICDDHEGAQQMMDILTLEQINNTRRFFGRLTAICRMDLGERYVSPCDSKAIQNWELLLEQHESAKEMLLKKAAKKAEGQLREKERHLRLVQALQDLESLIDNRKLYRKSEAHWVQDFRGKLADVLKDSGDSISMSLVRLVEPYQTHFKDGRQFRGLRRKFASASSRRPAIIDVTPKAESEQKALPERTQAELVWKGLFTGKKGLMLGGTPKADVLALIQEYFGFEKFDWLNPKDLPKNLGSVPAQVRNGGYDFVFLVARFAPHSVPDILKPVCKLVNVPFIYVNSGYGIGGICFALSKTKL